MSENQKLNVPWTQAEATTEIRKMARSKKLGIVYKLHAKERMSERGLIVSDVLYVLKNGFVHLEPTPATLAGFNKYAMESKSPNSGSRELRVVVIPCKKTTTLKIVTIMWVDETSTRSGSLIGEER